MKKDISVLVCSRIAAVIAAISLLAAISVPTVFAQVAANATSTAPLIVNVDIAPVRQPAVTPVASGPSTAGATSTAQTIVPAAPVPTASMSAAATVTPAAANAANLVPNPTLATAGTNGSPQGWSKGGWGTNTAVFTYPVTGYDDNFAAKVQISAYTNGDAKWYFNPVAITPGTYQFSDYYQSNIASTLTAQYTGASGALTYVDLATLGSSSTWKNASVNFAVPAGTTQITIFHLINGVGWLTVDDYSLTSYTAPVIPQPPAPTAADLILNPSLEYLDAGGLPIGWAKGGWGTNTSAYSVYHPGYDGNNAAQVSISAYTDGDAKWYFTPITPKPNYKYSFTDYYQSNIASYVTAEIQLSDGTMQYEDLGSLAADANWTQFTGTFSTPPNAKAVTVYHLIKAVGWLKTDNFGLVEVGPSQLTQGVVSIDFDDGWLSAYQKAYPILSKAGLKSTYYIFTDSFTDPDDYMTLAQVKILLAAGNEIGSHTKTHSDLTTLNSAQLTDEVSGSKSWFAQNGIKTTTFAYPYGTYNNVVEAAVKNAGYAGARTSDSGDNDKASNKYELKTYPVENTTTLADIEKWIDYAKQNKVWLVLLFHEILDNDSTEQYSTTPKMVQDTVNYLVGQKVPVLTNAQAIPLLGQ